MARWLVVGIVLGLGLVLFGCSAPAGGTAGFVGLVYQSDTGAPVAGATVSLVPSGTWTVTGADGRYTFDSVEGSSQIQVSAAGYSSRTLSIPAGATQLDVALLYVGLGDVYGVVIDAEGVPVAGVRVELGTASAVTGADGRYELLAVPGGSRVITVTGPGYRRLKVSVVVEPGTPKVLNLQLDREGAF